MNDPPTSLQFVTGTLVKDFMIPESMAMGGSIGTLEGVDPDGEDKLSFVMLEDGGGVFMLSNSSKCGPTTVQYQVLSYWLLMFSTMISIHLYQILIIVKKSAILIILFLRYPCYKHNTLSLSNKILYAVIKQKLG